MKGSTKRILALKERDRANCVCLGVPATNLQKLFLAIKEEYPILEYLVIAPSIDDSTAMTLPEALQAPHLRHLTLSGFTILLPSKCSSPMAFTHAPAADARD
jgi:hypothetical protein